MNEIDLFLKTKIIDIFMINESKIDSNIPSSFYFNPDYKIIRLDREGKGSGGEIVFIRKDHKILKYTLTDFETIYFQN